MFDQPNQGDLGCVPHPMKHRFTEKCATDCDPVESTGELALFPGFDGMRVTELMQACVALADLTIDPGIFTPRARIDHIPKGLGDLGFQKVFSQRPTPLML